MTSPKHVRHKNPNNSDTTKTREISVSDTEEEFIVGHSNPFEFSPKSVLQLQRVIGNQATIKLLRERGMSKSESNIQRESDLALGPLIKDLLGPKPSLGLKAVKFIGKWGKNASPFNILHTYVKLNWEGIKFWMKVSKAAEKGKALLNYIDKLEQTAYKLKDAIDLLSEAEADLPSRPLKTDDKAGQMTVTQAEMDYVERYYQTAASIANSALDAMATLRQAINGWDGALQKAHSKKDFTRASAWTAITLLDVKFSSQGGSFRGALETMKTHASQIEYFAREKQYHAADILGKWTPQGYAPPELPY